jgi:hypothetical protein
MSGGLGAGQLFVERPVPIVPDQDVDAIAIERHRQADSGEHLLQHGGVAM